MGKGIVVGIIVVVAVIVVAGIFAWFYLQKSATPEPIAPGLYKKAVVFPNTEIVIDINTRCQHYYKIELPNAQLRNAPRILGNVSITYPTVNIYISEEESFNYYCKGGTQYLGYVATWWLSAENSTSYVTMYFSTWTPGVYYVLFEYKVYRTNYPDTTTVKIHDLTLIYEVK